MTARGPQRIAPLCHVALIWFFGRLIFWLISPINMTGVLRCCRLREKLLAHRLYFKPLCPESVGFCWGFATHDLWLIVETCRRLLQVKFWNVGCPLITRTFVGKTDSLVRVGLWMNWILHQTDAILLWIVVTGLRDRKDVASKTDTLFRVACWFH